MAHIRKNKPDCLIALHFSSVEFSVMGLKAVPQ